MAAGDLPKQISSPNLASSETRIALIEFDSQRRPYQLTRFGIHIVARNEDSLLSLNPSVGVECDAWLIACYDEMPDGPTAAFRRWFNAGAESGVGICVLLSRAAETVRPWLEAGADSVAFADQSESLIAVAVHTAHNSGVIRRKLNARVAELEDKLEVTRLVNQAKSIMAKQLNISEFDALKRLRQESRSLRRPMVELAKVIIDAEAIVSGKLRESMAGTTKSRPKRRRGPSSADNTSPTEDESNLD